VATTEIIAVGNEILLGQVQDTNSSYLCRVVAGLGGRVRRIAVVADDVDAIARELAASLERKTDLIFTCGGLGPTDDDLTLAGVARAAGVQLELDEQARQFVARRYQELASRGHVATAEMTQSRLKMARLPLGSAMIENPVGTAPAISLHIGVSRVVSLPGVPAELKAITEGPLQSLLRDLFGRGAYRESEIWANCGDESQLAPLLSRAAALHPDVYIKSRASGFGPGIKFRVTLSASAKTAQEAESVIQRARDALAQALTEAGIPFSD
jgi:molybdenum cofactor synthesis domain-containing protein